MAGMSTGSAMSSRETVLGGRSRDPSVRAGGGWNGQQEVGFRCASATA